MTSERLTVLAEGMPIPFGGDRIARVPRALSEAFQPGDHLIVVQESGDLLRIPAREHAAARAAVTRAVAAFRALADLTPGAIDAFFRAFADRLEDPGVWRAVCAANAGDVERARSFGRSITRLAVSDAMRGDMISGLRGWTDPGATRPGLIERVEHAGWSVEQVVAPLGVVGFVFEGRPNVFADAAGVLKGGNTAVLRIGADALGTARAIAREALDPALAAAGLPQGAVSLLDEADRSAGHALFSDSRLALAVARGSGPAVAQLGAVARQAGVPVSLHGTGGAWMYADASADPARFAACVEASLDRKVCNTLNVCLIARTSAERLLPVFLGAIQAAGARRTGGTRLHVVEGDQAWLPKDLFTQNLTVVRADGARQEPVADAIPLERLAEEWEWEETPEISLKIVEDVNEAVALFNRFSPQFALSVIAEDATVGDRAFAAANAPFFSDGFTRWVDGQYAFRRPELGLSNWEHGRLFARGGVLSGDSVHTIRARARQSDPALRR